MVAIAVKPAMGIAIEQGAYAVEQDRCHDADGDRRHHVADGVVVRARPRCPGPSHDAREDEDDRKQHDVTRPFEVLRCDPEHQECKEQDCHRAGDGKRPTRGDDDDLWLIELEFVDGRDLDAGEDVAFFCNGVALSNVTVCSGTSVSGGCLVLLPLDGVDLLVRIESLTNERRYCGVRVVDVVLRDSRDEHRWPWCRKEVLLAEHR